MKHCPACNFSFPDFHRVCDFDGTELVPDDERRPLIDSSARPSRLRRLLNYPKSLTAAALLGLFLISALIGYLASPTRSIPVVKTKPSPASIDSRFSKSTSTPDSGNDSNKLASANSAYQRRQTTTSRALARSNKRPASRSRQSAIASRKDGKPTQSDNDPKLVAMLKTTWRVLTKPFRF